MAAEFAGGGFPAAEGMGVGWEAGVDAEIVEQAVEIKRQHVFGIRVLGGFKRAVEETDFA
jgi:hypothetical protein